jgi:hypothetical protein
MEKLNEKNTKIGDMIMNNNVAPNDALFGDTWVKLLINIVNESTLLLEPLTNSDDLDHHGIISYEFKCVHRPNLLDDGFTTICLEALHNVY